MAGTVEGGRRAAATNKMRYGKDFYRGIGGKGGRISRNHEWSKTEEGHAHYVRAGEKGGRASRRTKR